MKTLLLGIGTSALLLGSGACLQERAYVDPNQNVGLDAADNMALSDGSLRGDFGARRGFEGDATGLRGSSDPAYRMTTVHVVREQNDLGAGMIILSTSGKTLDELAVGEHTFAYDPNSLDENNIFVNVCSGVDAQMFDYDAPADRGTLTITPTADGQREVTVETETARLDPTTGAPTGDFETSLSTFTYQPGM